jgi:5-histidylcysteine sulfoxide synthase/putative 4-mercaptohistidine N1-methyltranferase
MTSNTDTLVKLADEKQAPLVTRTPLLNEGDAETKRQEILDYFHASFTLYESLFECLASDEAYYRRANRLRQPLIFYYGHTSVFFINKLNVANLINERVDPSLESILAIGVDEMSWDDLNDDNYDWPTPQQVKAHRDATREIVDRFIRNCDFSMPIDWNSPMWIVLMGIEHERIHLETSSILIRELPIEMVQPHPIWSEICRDDGLAPTNELIGVDGGTVALGKSQSNPIYGWDCEYGQSTEEVSSYKASKYLVSNQEMLEFVEAGGYENRKYWTEEGWSWIEFSKAKHPVYWRKEDGDYRLRTMLEEIDMPWSWPAELNYLEAKAFCNWKSEQTGTHIRMPSEAEWQLMRNRLKTDQPYWETAPGNINLEHELSPCPVDRHEFHDGLFDVIGNVWQWTETPVDAYDGFEVHPIYDDFSAPTFDGKHNLFKGGCWISTGNYAIKDARYAFRRHFFQYSGLRYIEAQPLPEIELNPCESDPEIASSIEDHFGELKLGVPNFQVACVDAIASQLSGRKTERALDIGCGSGRASFELAKHFQHVDAVDFSVRLIEAPANLQKSGRQRYAVPDEGALNSYGEVLLDAFADYQNVKDRISFMQGDACNLVEKYDDYDLVLAANLLENLYDPAKFLDCIKGRVRSGGLLVLASPYSWNEDVTPRDKWLGGFKANTGENFTSLDGIEKILGAEFALVGETKDIPFVAQKTKREFRYGISELSIWEKKS